MREIPISGVSLAGDISRSRCTYCCAPAFLAAALAMVATPAWAQTYKSIKPPIDQRAAKGMQVTVSRAIRDPAGFGNDEVVVQDYFMKYYFPQMTGATPESLAELGSMRENLFRRFIRASPNANSQKTLSGWALKVATALTQGNYHPAVRYNAVLILGDLDQQIAGGGTNATPPVPLPEATAAMLDLLEQSDFGGVAVHPSVMLGALVGLERHARFGIAPQHADRVTKAALDVIAQTEPPEDVSQDVHQWMKCQAASVLAWQHRQKPSAQALAALNGLMSDEAFDLENRAFVAGLLKRLDFTQAADLDAPAAITALGKLSQAVLKAESKLARDYQKEMLGNPGGNFRDFGARGFGDDDNSPKFERRQLLSRLRSIYDAGNSLMDGLPGNNKQQIEDLLDAMKPARLAAADKDATDLGVAERVIQAAQAVDQVTQSWNAGAAQADAAEADFS